MSKYGHRRLYNLQKSLYEQALMEAGTHAVIGSPTIVNYSQEFYQSLPRDYTKTNLLNIVTNLQKKDVLLFGDFHTNRQTQKGLVRVVDAYLREDPDRQIIFAMEMFRARDQELINDYLRDYISEEEFLKSVRYEENWGFSWENYGSIIDFAKEHGIQVIGISTDLSGQDKLTNRDRFAAHIIADIIKRYPECLCVSLIGEFHLADRHLPSHLPEEISFSRILTNIDEFYFQRDDYKNLKSTEYLLLKRDLFCLLNSPPWVKWSSYSLWEEHKIATEEEAYASFDIDYQIVSMMGHLLELIDSNKMSYDCSNFNSYYQLSETDMISIMVSRKVSPYNKALAIARSKIDGLFYIPESRILFLSKHSLNTLVESSGQILCSILLDTLSVKRITSIDAFYERVLIAVAGVVSSLIMNPKRRVPDIKSLHVDYKKLKNKRLNHGDAIYREALKYVINLAGKFETNKYRIHESIIDRDMNTSGIYSLMLGRLIGAQSYQNLISNKRSSLDYDSLLRLKCKPISSVFKLLVRYGFSK